MIKNPVVTVLMPVYNSERFLGQAIESILNQTFYDFEFLIIDDGSTDNSNKIIKHYASKDPRIKLLENTTNSGIVKSLNTGLQVARGEFIARMDSDDISFPNRLARQLNYLQVHSNIGVLGCAARIIDEDGIPHQTIRFPTDPGVINWSLCFMDPIIHPSVMMRKDIIIKHDGYSSDLLHSEDFELWQRLCWNTDLSNLREILFYLRRYDTNITKIHLNIQRKNAIIIAQRNISYILGKDVPSSMIENIWFSTCLNNSDIYNSANLIYDIHQSCQEKPIFSTTEKRKIKEDAAYRIYRLFRNKKLSNYKWKVLLLAIRLDPLLFFKRIPKVINHRLNMLKFR